MNIESSRDQKPNSMLIKTNLFAGNLRSIVFQYRLVEKLGKRLPLLETFREACLREIGRNTPENLLNKLLDLELGLFYTVKNFANIHFKMTYQGEHYDFELKYEGDVKDNFNFMRCLFNRLIYKSQMIQIDDFVVNPFDIKETDELSILPAFKIDFKRLDARNYFSVSCDMLFSPNLSVLNLIETLGAKGVDNNSIERIFKGKLVQTMYQSWAKYLKITRIMFTEGFDQYPITRFGKEYAFGEYFAQKHPYLQIKNPSQILVMGVPVNDRFETIRTQEEKVLVPELLQWVISNEDMVEIHGVDYYEACRISKRLMKYYYINRFMVGFLDRPQIRNELYRWRVDIERNPSTMGFHTLEFKPSLGMQNPKGQSRIERDLQEQERHFYNTVLENRAYSWQKATDIIIVYSAEISEKANKMIYEIGQCLNHFKYSDKKPEAILVDSDAIEVWKKTLERRLNAPNSGRVILCLTKDLDVEFGLREYLLKKNELFRVELISMSEEFKYDCFKAHHTLLLLNQLNNGQPWIVNEIVETNPIVVGACLFSQIVGKKFLLTFTSSWNKYFTKYITKMKIIDDITSANAAGDVKDFMGKCSKAMLNKLGLQELDFSAIIYIQVSMAKKLYSSFDRELTFRDELETQANHALIINLFKESISGFGQKSLVGVEVTPRFDISLFPSSRGAEKMDSVKIEYYSDLAHFKESRENLFSSFPDCVFMNYANNTRFILVSRYSSQASTGALKIVKEAGVNEYNIIHTVSVKEENVKKWVMTNTILYGCVDFENIEKYVCLPICLKLSQRATVKIVNSLENLTDDHVLLFNRYNGPAQLT